MRKFSWLLAIPLVATLVIVAFAMFASAQCGPRGCALPPATIEVPVVAGMAPAVVKEKTVTKTKVVESVKAVGKAPVKAVKMAGKGVVKIGRGVGKVLGHLRPFHRGRRG